MTGTVYLIDWVLMPPAPPRADDLAASAKSDLPTVGTAAKRGCCSAVLVTPPA